MLTTQWNSFIFIESIKFALYEKILVAIWINGDINEIILPKFIENFSKGVASNNKLLSNVSVQLASQGKGTDKDGLVEFFNLPNGNYAIAISAMGYLLQRIPVTLPDIIHNLFLQISNELLRR